jgi:hypothetical protein
MFAGAGLENTALRVLSCLLFMVLYHDTVQGLATANDIADAWEKPLTRALKNAAYPEQESGVFVWKGLFCTVGRISG